MNSLSQGHTQEGILAVAQVLFTSGKDQPFVVDKYRAAFEELSTTEVGVRRAPPT